MQRAAAARHNKRLDLVVKQLPDVRQFKERYAVGSFSVTGPKERYTVKDAADYVYGDFPVTAPELARDYLDLCYPQRLRASGAQAESYTVNRFAPLYYRPMVSKFAYYVDIRGAYWWIMSQVGWDVDYHPGYFLSPGRAPYDFPFPNNKLARNCLVSIGTTSDLQVWTGHRMINQHTYNPHLNMGLYACVTDILHLFGYAARNLGACYVSTDGVIIDDRHIEEYLGYLSRFHVPYHFKYQGDCIVTGLGSYRFGNEQTLSFRPDFERPTSNLRRPLNSVMLEKSLISITRDRLDRPQLFKL